MIIDYHHDYLIDLCSRCIISVQYSVVCVLAHAIIKVLDATLLGERYTSNVFVQTLYTQNLLPLSN